MTVGMVAFWGAVIWAIFAVTRSGRAGGRRWTILLGALTMLVVPTVVVLGVRAGASGSNAPPTAPSAFVRSDAPRPIAVGRQEDDRQRVADAGEPLDAHLVMLEQMRDNVTPQMVQTMN
ncbi:MAG TPA: hypothetical protein VLN74_01970, partial [Ilumatobacteraceae bacterium]|nr:hypothetical protein [Ilumatobacteraceae bacterium]